MKKGIFSLISFVLAAAMALSLVACDAAPKDTGVELKVAALKGPTAIGLVHLMDEAAGDNTANTYDFTLAGAPDELTGPIVSGNYDIAVVPTNLAATLYNKTEGAVQIVALVTKGVLYVVTTRDDIKSIGDLAGKTVLSSGKGTLVEYAFDHILEQNGVEVTTEYAAEHSEVAAKLASGDADIAVLPQPFVTSALKQNPALSVALDLTAEWDAVATDGSALVMSAVIAQKSTIEEHPEAIEAFLKEYEASVGFITDANNLDAAASSVVAHGIIANEEIAAAAIPECNIVWMVGDQMRDAANGFFGVLHGANPQSVGGKLPDDGIFYSK